jgi:hypothetical protein
VEEEMREIRAKPGMKLAGWPKIAMARDDSMMPAKRIN